MTIHNDTVKQQFEKSSHLVLVNGIIALIFGILGSLFGIMMIVLASFPELYDGDYTFTVSVITQVIIFISFVLPHVYLIVSGIILMHTPRPNVVKGLIITNLIVSVSSNIVILVLSIISLVGINQYENGYHHKHTKES
jgi:hypothetical protein